MKKILFIFLTLCVSLSSHAQSYSESTAIDSALSMHVADAVSDQYTRPIPYNNNYGMGLHPGLNLSVDLSAFATFGHNVPHRGGFGERLTATYLANITDKLWIAAGGYIQNTNWGGDNYRDGGLYAVLGYKFNEHWEAYIYGQKSIANNYGSMYNRYDYYGCAPGYFGYLPGVMGYGYGYGGLYGPAAVDRIGATVKYNFNPNFSVQVSVEGDFPKNREPHYFDQYNYPVK
jgi:hypothetical protein